MDPLRGTSPSKAAVSSEPPEQLLDAFKAAALSVTKLYKTSAAAQAKARADGYQDCLDDLLAFLDKSGIGLGDGEGWQIRKWATERLDGRDATQAMESEDEVEKPEPLSSPEIHRPNDQTHVPAIRPESNMRHESSTAGGPRQPTNYPATEEHPPSFAVPTRENFTFQSSHPYPQESYPNLANLDLSDSARANENTTQCSSTVPIAHPSRSRNSKRGSRPRPTNLLGKGAGQKRPINFAELFDLGGIAFGKDVFGRDGKRSRHT
ncbi:hypothetical protein GGS23DRAFT_577512 [Durotheca rogersii]|uniref:uncharacterized protein n=1 Tax=Durotheca rogersii TaxID=419775 RepID=UPI00221FF5D5|nr:uncharacterized protein GGS23DRAFT_577512 [Durotheca rogersii]KAI5861190.1 hypothetical protein GGS23DRAFT_577512 [Durotheca rogersii]